MDWLEEIGTFSFACSTMTNLSLLKAEAMSVNENIDDQSHIVPHILEFYNDFYEQQMMVYDTLFYMPDDLAMIDASNYNLYYPIGDQARLYTEQTIPTTETTKTFIPSVRPNQCQHPKHQVYATLFNASQSTMTPRRGRPPKGSKPTDCSELAQLKRLPKRLESVVGVSEIYVCLTCLRRTDDDVEYNTSPKYIPPMCGRAGRGRRSTTTWKLQITVMYLCRTTIIVHVM